MCIARRSPNVTRLTPTRYETTFIDRRDDSFRAGSLRSGVGSRDAGQACQTQESPRQEGNTDSAKKSRWLDHLTIYDEKGRKVEEAEYNQFGQVERVTCEYDPQTDKVVREVVYDDRDKPVRIRKYEYNDDGTKRKQYNYLPNGKLYTVKVFEYVFED